MREIVVSPAEAGSALGRTRTDRRRPLVLGGLVFVVYATTLPSYELQVTDVSAWRMLHGAVPYRDFWTMYAPGSFTLLAGGFAVFGRELIVSRLLGMLTAAAAVVVHYRLTAHLAPSRIAWIPSIIFAAAFFGTGYYASFTSYPPAILTILLAVDRLAKWAVSPAAHHLVIAGLWLGAAALFKHDVAAYALAAMSVACVAVSPARSIRERVRVLLIVVGAAGCVTVPALLILIALGAGHDLLRNLVVFPLTDFRYVRPEYFPIVPSIRSGVVPMVKELVHWSTCNLPTIALVMGLPGLWRGRAELTALQRLVVTVMLSAYPLYWLAAHVQLNTHAITLSGIGAMIAAAGLARSHVGLKCRRPVAVGAVLVTAWWSGAVCLERLYQVTRRATAATERVALPGLAGISAPREDAAWMRGLAAELERGDPRAALLMLGNRNDVLVFADSTPYWLSTRRPATRYHELHPGITDTESVQREMVNALAAQPLPVLVREHRFDGKTLDRVKGEFLQHVSVGATLLDHWVREHYTPGLRFGRYEVMRPRPHGERLPES